MVHRSRHTLAGAVVLPLLAVGGGFYAMFWAGEWYGGNGVMAAAATVLLLWLILVGWFGTKYGRRAMPVILLALLAQCGGCLVSLQPLSWYFVRESSYRAACAQNLKQIGMALQAYSADHGSFPPAYVADASGKRLHSWRLLILPHLESESLYDRFVLTEPWDGQHNQEPSKVPLTIFQCPRLRLKNSTTTSYLAVTGQNTVWPGAKGSKLDDLKHGPANTILLVEVADSDVAWAEPRDLDIFAMVRGTGLLPSSRHDRHGFHVLFADGSVHYLDWNRVRTAIGPDGAGKVDPKECEIEFPPRND